MLNIGFPELILIVIVALLVIGPSKLPEVARTLGKAMGEFKRMADGVKESWEKELDQNDEGKEDTKEEEKQSADNTGDSNQESSPENKIDDPPKKA
jgi:Tat protein translocase TatB subunit